MLDSLDVAPWRAVSTFDRSRASKRAARAVARFRSWKEARKTKVGAKPPSEMVPAPNVDDALAEHAVAAILGVEDTAGAPYPPPLGRSFVYQGRASRVLLLHKTGALIVPTAKVARIQVERIFVATLSVPSPARPKDDRVFARGWIATEDVQRSTRIQRVDDRTAVVIVGDEIESVAALVQPKAGTCEIEIPDVPFSIVVVPVISDTILADLAARDVEDGRVWTEEEIALCRRALCSRDDMREIVVRKRECRGVVEWCAQEDGSPVDLFSALEPRSRSGQWGENPVGFVTLRKRNE